MIIKLRNSLIVLAVLLAAIIVLVSVTYHSANVVIESTVLAHQQNVAAQAAATTEMWLKHQMQVVDSAIDQINKIDPITEASSMPVLKMALAAGDFSDVYIGLEDGTMIDGAEWVPPAGYDPRVRPWYINAVEKGKMAVSPPYIDMTTREMVIALSAPLYRDDRVIGVISNDIILDMLVKNVMNVKAAETGYSFIVNSEGTFMVHPDQELLLTHSLQDTDPTLRRVMEHFKSSDSGTFSYKIGGQENILAYQLISSVGWYLCTTMTKEEAYALSERTSMLFAAESALRAVGFMVLLTMSVVGVSAFLLFIYNRRYKSTVLQHAEQISGMNQDLAWNINRRKEVETHYQTLFHVANDAILISKGMIIVECNEKAKEVFGVNHYGIIGNNMLDLSPEIQPDGEVSLEKVRRIINKASEGEQQSFMWSFLRSDGTEFPCEVNLKSQHLNKEEFILISIRDISKRVNAEQQLRQAQKMAAMGEMLGAIAHQWRQPLNTLSTYVVSIQSAFYNNMISKEFVEKLVTAADSQIQFMSKTIDDFRHFFKPSKNKEHFSIADVVDSSVKLMQPNFKQSGIVMKLNVPDDAALVVYGYRSEFVHVIVNILANARDAVVEKLSSDSDADSREIKIDVENLANNVMIHITDRGCGITESMMPKIFNPYFTTKGTASGTGMGLYMAKMIVENEMHGTITVKSGDGKTVFTVSLPKHSEAE